MTTPTFDMRGGNGPTRVMAIERMSSSRIASLIASTAGLKRSTWPTIRVTPARRAAAMMSRPSSTVDAIGFSTRTWTPRAMQVERDIAMQMGRRRDGHGIDAEIEQRVDVGDGRAAERAARRIRACLRSGSATPTSSTPGSSGEHARMVAAHDADADHADAQCAPRLSLPPHS